MRLLLAGIAFWAVSFSSAQTVNNNSDILALEQALYQYEFEGKKRQAIETLQELTHSKNPDVALQASHFLGRISEQRGQLKSATHLYKKVYSSRQANLPLRLWTAGRLHDISYEPVHMVNDIKESRFPVKDVISQTDQLFLFTNGKIASYKDHNFFTFIRQPPPSPYSLYYRDRFLYSISPSLKQIILTPIYTSAPELVVDLDSPFQSFQFINNSEYLIFTESKIIKQSLNRNIWTRNNRFPNCKSAGQMSYSEEVLVQCPDNSLHFLDITQGRVNNSISILENIQQVLTQSDGFALAAENILYRYKPSRSLSPIWKGKFRKIRTILNFRFHILLQQQDGDVSLIDDQSGKVYWTISPGEGDLYTLGDYFAVFTPEGTFQYFDYQGNLLWNYQTDGKLSAPPTLIGQDILLPMKNGNLIFLNPFYLGVQPSYITQKLAQAEQLASAGQWEEIRPVLKELLRQEPGNSEAWLLASEYYSQFRNQQDSAKLSLHKSVVNYKNIQDKIPGLMKKYSNALGAEWVRFINFNANFFPELHREQNFLFYVDGENQQLHAINPKTGEDLWQKETGWIDPSPLMIQNSPYLMISAGYSLKIYDITRKAQYLSTIDLPGKPQNAFLEGNALFVSCWNGEFSQIDLKTQNIIWTRNFGDGPLQSSHSESDLFLTNKQTLYRVKKESGYYLDSLALPYPDAENISIYGDKLLIGFHNGEVILWNPENQRTQWEVLTGAQIFNWYQRENVLYLGLSNQQIIAINLSQGKISWKYQGELSLFVKPFFDTYTLYMDQGNRIVELDLKTGEALLNMQLPEAVGPVFSAFNRIFFSTRSGLLFSFGKDIQTN
jgi:outer membrane protein assembly factor BamB